MITTMEQDAKNERLPPCSVDGDPRYTYAVLTFILHQKSGPPPAEKFHGDDCVGLAEIDRPVSLIVVLRRQNAVKIIEKAITQAEPLFYDCLEAENMLGVGVDSGAGWISDAVFDNGSAALFGSPAKGNVVCRNSKHGA